MTPDSRDRRPVNGDESRAKPDRLAAFVARSHPRHVLVWGGRLASDVTIRGLLRAAVACGVLTIAVASPASAVVSSVLPAAAPSDDVTFSVQPAGRSGPDGRSNFDWGLTPGARLADRVAVVNYSPQPLPLRLYATDALNTDEGGFGLLATSDKPQDLGSWITLEDVGRQVVVPAATGSQPGVITSAVQVQVPDRATPGDHSAGIVAVLTTADTDGQAQIQLEQRVASRVFARVSGEAEPSLDVRDLQASYRQSWNPLSPGSAEVTYVVVNDGNINLSASQVVQALGPVADSKIAAPDIDLLLPGGSVPVTVTLDRVWPQVRMGAEAFVTPRDVSTPDLSYPVVVETVTLWTIPWIWIALVAGVAIAGLGAWLLRRGRRRGRPLPKHSATSPGVARV